MVFSWEIDPFALEVKCYFRVNIAGTRPRPSEVPNAKSLTSLPHIAALTELCFVLLYYQYSSIVFTSFLFENGFETRIFIGSLPMRVLWQSFLENYFEKLRCQG